MACRRPTGRASGTGRSAVHGHSGNAPRLRCGRSVRTGGSLCARSLRGADQRLSGGRPSSVFGMPSSAARLSASASRRRIRPAMASLVMGGSARAPSSSRLACLCSRRRRTGGGQVVGHRVPEDLQGALDPRARRDGRARGAAQVRVVEVGQPVGGRADLAAHPPLLPGQQGLVGAQPGEHRADGVAVADDDAVDPADLTGLGRDAQPARRPDQRQRRLGTGTGDLQRRRAARLGQRPVRQEGAAPGGLGVAQRAVDDRRREPADRAAGCVDESGLPGEPLPVLGHRQHVPVAPADPRRRDDRDGARDGRRRLRWRRGRGGRPRRCRAPPRPPPGRRRCAGLRRSAAAWRPRRDGSRSW